jgi:hypothetical protein
VIPLSSAWHVSWFIRSGEVMRKAAWGIFVGIVIAGVGWLMWPSKRSSTGTESAAGEAEVAVEKSAEVEEAEAAESAPRASVAAPQVLLAQDEQSLAAARASFTNGDYRAALAGCEAVLAGRGLSGCEDPGGAEPDATVEVARIVCAMSACKLGDYGVAECHRAGVASEATREHLGVRCLELRVELEEEALKQSRMAFMNGDFEGALSACAGILAASDITPAEDDPEERPDTITYALTVCVMSACRLRDFELSELYRRDLGPGERSDQLASYCLDAAEGGPGEEEEEEEEGP